MKTKTKDITAAVRKGETLCRGYAAAPGPQFWLEPSNLAVSADLAQQIIALPGVKAAFLRLRTSLNWVRYIRGRGA